MKVILPLVWLVVDFLTVEVFLVVVLSLDWLVDGAGLDRKSEKKKWVITRHVIWIIHVVLPTI